MIQIIGTNQNIGEALKSLFLKDAVVNLSEVIQKCWHNLLLPLANEVDNLSNQE